MNKLTAAQAKMVIEYFIKEAATNAPVTDLDWKDWDKHMWMTCYTTSLAIERRINERDWATLLNAALGLQQFDRDPEGYLFERGYDPAQDTAFMQNILDDVFSATVDMVYSTSKLA